MKVNASLVRSIIEPSIENLYDAMHRSITPKTRRYSDGYVFDEDKSVKWNKEQVEIKNAEYEAEREQLIKEQDNIIQKICDDMAKDILDKYNDYDLGLTLPEIQLAINHAVDRKFDMDKSEENIIRNLQILIDCKELNICKEVYIVHSTECSFDGQILGVFTNEDAAYNCEVYWNENDCGSTNVECKPVMDKFEKEGTIIPILCQWQTSLRRYNYGEGSEWKP